MKWTHVLSISSVMSEEMVEKMETHYIVNGVISALKQGIHSFIPC